MALINQLFDFSDFDRFFYDEVLQNSDFFEETCLKIYFRSDLVPICRSVSDLICRVLDLP